METTGIIPLSVVSTPVKNRQKANFSMYHQECNDAVM
jgi:hypothetical protein